MVKHVVVASVLHTTSIEPLDEGGSVIAEAPNPQCGPFWLKGVVPYTLFICGRLRVTITSVFLVLQATLTRASVDDSAQRPVSIALARFVAGVLHSIGHSL